MATNPFEVQPGPFGVQPQPGMPQLTPQTGEVPGAEGSYFTLSPEAMQMMWAPPPQQIQAPPLPPIQPLV
jgi:hypothetical protein